MAISISFFGAAGTVTGSKHLVEIDGSRILLDCGMSQGEGRESDLRNRSFGFDPASIDVLVLSHAHIDHSGLLPRFVAEGFRGIIWCTPATRDLCAIMLADSAHIQESDFEFDAKRAKKQGRRPEWPEPLYTAEDVKPTLAKFQTLPYATERRIAKGVHLMYTDAGHILGSAAAHLRIEQPDGDKHISFTGDVGRYVDRLLPDPAPFPQCDVLICESTYGDRDHASVEEAHDELLHHVQRVCVEQQGKLLIPAFSIGKTQEILYTLNVLSNAGKLPRIPVFVDSPLSINATAVYREHSQLLQEDVRAELRRDPDLFSFPGVQWVQKAEQSKALNAHKEPCIIIAASGMMEAGRIRHHLRYNLHDEKNAVLIVGFCAPGSLGAKLMEGASEVRIFGDVIPVRAAILRMDFYSAHAGQSELMRYISCQDPAKVQQTFLVHGIERGLTALKAKCEAAGFRNVVVPKRGERFEI
ncbi:MAG: MBL fold metallo-hydrolase [Flavobacteriales bacterium]